jgi:hypothetical protein
MGKTIKVPILRTEGDKQVTYEMTIKNSEEVSACFVKGSRNMFEYRGVIYETAPMKTEDFYRLFPHLITNPQKE